MAGQEVLPADALRDRVRVQDELPDPPVGHRWADLGALHQLDDLLAGGRGDQVPGVGRRVGEEVLEAGQPRLAGVAVQAVDTLAAEVVEPRAQCPRMQENGGPDERCLRLPALLAGVVPDQRGQPLGLAVGQDQRVVLGGEPAARHPAHPLGAVTGELALPVLEFQHIQAARRQHQGVDLVDRPVGADELDIRPYAVWVGVGQVGGKLPQSIILVLECAAVDVLPTGRVLPHECPSRLSFPLPAILRKRGR